MRAPRSTRCTSPADFLQGARHTVRRRTATMQAVQRSRRVLLPLENPELGSDAAAEHVGLRLDKSNDGVDAGQPGIFPSTTERDAAERPIFPPLDRALIRAMAPK